MGTFGKTFNKAGLVRLGANANLPALEGRYLIGDGDRNWNDTANWSTTSGGIGGASVPTTADNVIFDSNSGSGTITIDVQANCLDFICTNISAITLNSAIFEMHIYGGLSLHSNLTWYFTGTAYTYLKATDSRTIKTAGLLNLEFNELYFDGVGGEWTLQDDFRIYKSNFTFKNGTFNTNDKNITYPVWDTTHARLSHLGSLGSSFAFNVGSSTIECAIIENLISNAYAANFTLNAGTSTFKFNGSSNKKTIQFYGGLEFYDVIFDQGDRSYGQQIEDEHTFRNLTLNNAVGNNDLEIAADQTITGTLTINSYNATDKRAIVKSYTSGVRFKLTAANVVANNCDFRDIEGAGTGNWDFSGQEIGDCGGNSGITFRAGENRYWFEGTGNFHDAKWFSATNGGGVAKPLPLPQDTAIFDTNSFSGAATFTVSNKRLPGFDMSDASEAISLIFTNNIEVHGSFLLGANTTPTIAQYVYLYGIGNYSINTHGKQMLGLFFYNGSYTLLSDSNIGYIQIRIPAGSVIDFNDFNVDLAGYFLANAYGDIYLGNGTFTIKQSSSSPFDVYRGNIYPEGSTIVINPQSGSAQVNFHASDITLNKIWFKGEAAYTGEFKTTDGFTAAEIKIDAGRTVKFDAGKTVNVGNIVAIGTASEPITIKSDEDAIHTLNYTGAGVIECDYLDLSYSNATQTNTFYAGANSTDSGNNTNWIFTAAP